MTAYTPTTDQVRVIYSTRFGNVTARKAAFDRWLDSVTIQAHDEGVSDAYYAPEGQGLIERAEKAEDGLRKAEADLEEFQVRVREVLDLYYDAEAWQIRDWLADLLDGEDR